ncbi:MAG TPA: RagB/SusD family nutrient uptake outer membrane protein, partial [Pedobacter sp.]|nr:RagB/SusD family nutrient uptake outer membrane protein [Pedobacter sp.]
MKNKYIIIALLLSLCSCKKEWLDVKRDKSLVVPSTLQDLQLMFNYEDLTAFNHIGLAQYFSDDFYMPNEVLSSVSQIERDAYVWKDEMFQYRTAMAEWNGSYAQIFTANLILETLETIERTSTNKNEWDNVKGAALSLRSRAFFNLAQCFAPVYSSANATSLAIPLKVKSDILAPVKRATVKETYNQIVNDLKTSVELLPNVPKYKVDASKASSYGQLARIYLVMGDYDKALINANLCLGISNELIDYNTVDLSNP